MISKLEEIGLTKAESVVYLAILDLGHSTVSEIAKHAKLHRSNTHDTLQRLVTKGLVNYHTSERTKYYEPSNPSNLMNMLKQKEILLNSIVPELVIKYSYSKSKSDIEVHEGIVSFRNLLLEQLEKTKKIYVMGVPYAAVTLLTKPFLIKFHEQRVAKKIDFYHLLNSDYPDERVKYLIDMPHTFAKKLPGSYSSLVGVNIFEESILLTIWINPIITVEIRNKEMAEAYTEFFNILWRQK